AVTLQIRQAGMARGVLIEEEEDQVRVVAEQIVKICVKLALPEQKNLDALIRMGRDAADFLQGLDGLTRDDPRLQALDDQRGRLLLVRSIARRAQQPARVRKDFERILEYWDTRGDAFLRGQCWLYLSILKDREPDRAGLERAYALFLQAWRESGEREPRLLFFAARAQCVIAKLFKDPEAEKRGKQLLKEVEKRGEKIRIPKRLRSEILGERQTCSSGA
ncbi:MAG: hypothetical protein O7C98_05155, partial [Planctomycetota bacterium]|nr:hypothetical protein [Planctomycetota bacterium]